MTLVQENRVLLMLVFTLSGLLVLGAIADRFKWRAKRMLIVGTIGVDLIFVAGSAFVFGDLSPVELILVDSLFVTVTIIAAIIGYWFVNWRLATLQKRKDH